MPAQAGIQGDQVAASGYSAWIPAFAGMTRYSSAPQNHHDRLLQISPSSISFSSLFYGGLLAAYSSSPPFRGRFFPNVAGGRHSRESGNPRNTLKAAGQKPGCPLARA